MSLSRMMTRSAKMAAALLAGALALAAGACSKPSLPEVREEPSGLRPGEVEVEFFIGSETEEGGEPTKITSVSASNESKINRWAVFLFDASSGAMRYYGTSSGSGSITKTVNAGTYDVCAVVNYPTSGSGAITPSAVTTKSGLEGMVSYLADNSASSLVMSGSKQYTFTEGDNGTKSIPVKRLVAKLGIQRIRVQFASPADQARTFVLKGVYATNVYSRTQIGSDYPTHSIDGTRSLWYNTMGWGTSGSCTSPASPTALLGDRGLSETIYGAGGVHTTPHYFYVYPNSVNSDSHSATWSARHTRIVIEATIDGTTVYYQVNLPVLFRNNTYIAEEAVIARIGSLDPEQEIPGAVTVTFAESPAGWDGPTAVSETS